MTTHHLNSGLRATPVNANWSTSPVALLIPRGPAIRRARLTLGLSQRELAIRAGLRQATISSLERGNPARPSTVRLLAKALHTSITAISDIPTPEGEGDEERSA